MGRTYQPLAVALDAVAVEVLDGDVLRLEPRAESAVDESLVDGAEPALAEEVGGGEVLGGGLELVQREGVQLGGLQLPRQVLQRQRPQVRRAQPPQRRLPAGAPARRRPLRRRRGLLLLLAAAGPEAPQQALPQPHDDEQIETARVDLVSYVLVASPHGPRSTTLAGEESLGAREGVGRWRSGEVEDTEARRGGRVYKGE